MKIFIIVVQLILSLSLLVLIHEFGHYFFARLFNTRVEKFYLFFNPWFSLFKFKRGDTEYGIGWIPIGGYVKISGMIDESMDKEQLKKPPQPYEFRSKNSFQRLLIMLGGILFNLISGLIIFAFILTVWGKTYLPSSELKEGIMVTDSLGYEIGLQTGDKILSVNGKSFENFAEPFEEMLYAGKDQGKIIVDRNGERIELTPPVDLSGRLEGMLYYARVPFIVEEVIDTLHNANSGLKAGDIIIKIDSIPIKYFDQRKTILSKFKSQKINVQVKRDSSELIIPVKIDSNGLIGITPEIPSLTKLDELGIYNIITIDYTFLEAIPASFKEAKTLIKKYLRQFKLIFSPKTKAYKKVGSVGAMSKLFDYSWNWEAFWTATVLLSLVLAIMNLLPIPALDGGHVVFLLFEIITGRKPGDKFMEYAQLIGMIIILTLMFYALGNDFGLIKWFRNIFGG